MESAPSSRASHFVSERLALNALFLGALGIAFAPIFVRLSPVGPSATAFWRVAISLPVFYLWMRLEGKGTHKPRQPTSPRDVLRLAAAGVFFAGDLGVWHWSIRYTSVANATLLANFAPIFVALGGWLFLRQRVSLQFVLGMAVALAGTAFLVGQSANISAQHLWGDLLGVVTAVFYAGYILAVKELRREYSTATIMTWTAAISGVVLLPVAWLMEGQVVSTSALGWLLLVGLALVSQFGGQTLIAFALAKLPAAFSSVGLLVQPVAAAVFAWLLLGERMQPVDMLGGALALAGIFIARRASS